MILQLGGIAPGGNRVTSPTEHWGGNMKDKEDLKSRAAFQYREKKKELAMSMRRVKAWIIKHADDADRVADLKDYLQRLELEDLFWTKHRKNKKG